MTPTGPAAASGHAVQSAQGEDRSSHQPISPWTAANKFGFAKATEALDWTDPTFGANWQALREEGKFRGAYHFLHPNLDPEAQAVFFLDYVHAHGGLEPGDMLVVDSEIAAGHDDSGRADAATGSRGGTSHRARAQVPVAGTLATPNNAGETTLAFLHTVASVLGPAHSRHPTGVYTNLSVAALLKDCTRHFLWIAYPADKAPPNVLPWSNWRFWQWEFGGGPGGGDRDAYNGTLPELTEWIRSFREAPSAST
jgi:GH25 family lysozyme M1 (1,4-beta-N-acetylmuramidase)